MYAFKHPFYSKNSSFKSINIDGCLTLQKSRFTLKGYFQLVFTPLKTELFGESCRTFRKIQWGLLLVKPSTKTCNVTKSGMKLQSTMKLQVDLSKKAEVFWSLRFNSHATPNTSHLICITKQLTGFHMISVPQTGHSYKWLKTYSFY